jgi:hypothetical protein
MAKKKAASSMTMNWWSLVVIVIVLAIGYWWWAKQPTQMTSNGTVTVQLAAQNGSKEYGTATLTEVNGKVNVSLNIMGAPTGVSQPAHIHMGACPNPGSVVYPLTSPVNGRSETTLNVTLAQLKAQLPLAVNVHKSTTMAGTYVACGNLSL